MAATETAWPNESTLCRKHIWKFSIKIAHFISIRSQTWPSQAILVFDWLISKKSSLKPSGQMNRNLVGSLYWRFCIQTTVSSKQNERWATQVQPTEPLVYCDICHTWTLHHLDFITVFLWDNLLLSFLLISRNCDIDLLEKIRFKCVYWGNIKTVI